MSLENIEDTNLEKKVPTFASISLKLGFKKLQIFYEYKF